MNHLDLMREASARKRAEMAAAGIRVVVLNPIERARKHPTSWRKAITAKCCECCGAGADGWKYTRETIKLCTASETCSLWTLRPYQKAKNVTDDNVIDDDAEDIEECEEAA